MSKAKQRGSQIKISKRSTQVYDNSRQGMVPTPGFVLDEICRTNKEFLPKHQVPSCFIRPITFEWVNKLKQTSMMTIWDLWSQALQPYRTKRIINKKYPEHTQLMKKNDIDDLMGLFEKETGGVLINAEPSIVKAFVKKHIKKVFKLIAGNLPFGHHTDTQGQYVCWRILYLNFFMLCEEEGLLIEIIPISLFNSFGSQTTSKLYNLILPKLEILDCDTNSFFKKVGNEPGIKMCTITVNMKKKNDVVKVRKDGVWHTVKHDELLYFLHPDFKVTEKIAGNFKKLPQIKDVYICDVRQNIGKFSDGVPASKTASIKEGFASKQKTKTHVIPYYYSSITTLYTTQQIADKHYNTTRGTGKIVFNYNGHFSQFGKEKHYMPYTTDAVGKCAEGIEVKNNIEYENVLNSYNRKLPLYFVKKIKGSNEFNGGLYLLPWFDHCKQSAISDKEWYDSCPNLNAEDIKTIEDWYDNEYKK
jgi:hypothetical protein